MKKLYLFTLIVMVLCAAVLLSPQVAGAEEFLRAAFVAHIDETDNIVSFVDSCGLCFKWEVREEEDICEYNLLDEFLFKLTGDKVTEAEMNQPTYSGIHVDKEWAIRILWKYYPEFIEDIINTGD